MEKSEIKFIYNKYIMDNPETMINKEILKQVNEYFASLKKCENCPGCVYMGTIDERLKKYNELKNLTN